MNGRMDWVQLDGSRNIESSLLESQAKSTRSSEQVYYEWTLRAHR